TEEELQELASLEQTSSEGAEDDMELNVLLGGGNFDDVAELEETQNSHASATSAELLRAAEATVPAEAPALGEAYVPAAPVEASVPAEVQPNAARDDVLSQSPVRVKRKRPVTRLRMMSGSPAFVAPSCEYNDVMKAAFSKLWLSLGQRRIIDASELLMKKYNAYCATVRNKERELGENQPPLELLPVTLTAVKEYLKARGDERAAPFRAGSLDEVSRAETSNLRAALDASDDAFWKTTRSSEEKEVRVEDIVRLPPSCEAKPPPLPESSAARKKRERDELKEEETRAKKAARLAKKAAWTDADGKVSDTKKLDDLLQGRQERALATLKSLGLQRERRKPGDPQICAVCGQFRGKAHKGPNNQIHHIIGRKGRGGGRIWCPYVDPISELEADMADRREKLKARNNRYYQRRKQLEGSLKKADGR
ncbi:hypothetical protein FOZ63_006930, partial [Perkinsus olseni]